MTKLKSDTGASLSFALLLFLVCATVGLVVLAAGTASSGRLSELSKMDQRYYSVASAAQVLAEELTGKKVKIERIKTITTVENLETGDTTNSTTYSTKVNDGTPVVPVPVTNPDGNSVSDLHLSSFLSEEAAFLLFGGNNCNTQKSFDEYSMYSGFSNPADPTTEPPEIGFTHTSVPSSIPADSLKIKGNATLKADGTLILMIRNSVDPPYTVNVVLTPIIDETQSYLVDSSGGPNSVTTVTTTTITSEIEWELESIQKEVSDVVI